MAPITERDLAFAHSRQLPLIYLTTLLGVHRMGPADHILTKHEAKAYLESGDVGAARALIQHAHGRREQWKIYRPRATD